MTYSEVTIEFVMLNTNIHILYKQCKKASKNVVKQYSL